MPDYNCPNCDGGFPKDHDECPWCGTALDGTYGNSVVTPHPSNTVPNIDLPDHSNTFDFDQITTPQGTTPCPDCGDRMPMTTWHGDKPKCRKCQLKSNQPFSYGGL